MPVKRARRTAPPETRDVDTEQRILDAAHEVFLRHGTAGARMQDIARQAGVNQALLHYYFRSKERLAEAVFRRAATNLIPPVFRILSSDASLAEKVQRVIAHELDQLSRTPHLPAYVLAEVNQQPERAGQFLTTMTGMTVDGVAPQVLAGLARQIEEQVRAGAMRPIRPEQFIINLLSLCIFPFAARPMLCAVLGWTPADFAAFIERRRKELPTFFFEGLRP